VLGKGFELDEAEVARKAGGVAELEVAIQRQVVGDERDVRREQQADALAEGPNQSWRFGAVPQHAVVDDDRVCAVIDRASEECARSGNRGNDPLHVGGPFNLETVRTVVSDGVGFEEIVEIGHELMEVHGCMVPHRR